MTAANSMIMNNTPQSYNAFFRPSTVETLQERMELENLTPEIPLHDRGIEEYSISRLSFQLTGFFDFFPYKRVQIIGKNEYEYMKTLDEAVLTNRIRKLVKSRIVEELAWLVWIHPDLIEWNLRLASLERTDLSSCLSQQRLETPSKTAVLSHVVPPLSPASHTPRHHGSCESSG